MSTGYQMDQTFAVWRILVGAVIIVAIYGLGLFGVGFFLYGMAGIDLTQSSQTTLIVFLASFIPIWLGTGAVTRVLFGFSLPHLYGQSGKIRWLDFRVAFAYIFVIVLRLELFVIAVTWIMGVPPYARNGAVSILDWLIYSDALDRSCFSANRRRRIVFPWLFVAIDLFAQGALVLGGLHSIIFVWFGPS